MLLIRWILEQGVWAAPLAGVALYLWVPREQRSSSLTAVTFALAALLVANFTGVYPGPATVSCVMTSGLSPVCTERTTGAGSILPAPAAEPPAGSAEAEPRQRHGDGSLLEVPAGTDSRLLPVLAGTPQWLAQDRAR